MDEYTNTFAPINQSWDLIVLIFATLAIVGIIALVYYLIKPSSTSAVRTKSLLSFLFAAALLLLISLVIYTWTNTYHFEEITITGHSIITPFGVCEFDNIKKATLIKLPPNLKQGGIDSVTFLLIEEYTGKAHPISEEDYNVKAILRNLNRLLDEKKQ